VKAIDICAGAGGLSLGLHRAGFDVLGVERDPEAVEVHRRHVGPCELADVTEWHPSGPADLAAGGVPCQPFSAAGKRLGTFDPRGSLFRHLVRVAVEADARAVLLENVLGLWTWRSGEAFRAIVDCYREAGFEHVVHVVLDAADFGVPQHRRRLFVIGFRERVRFEWPLPTHGPSLWARRPWVSVREALGLGPGTRRSGPLPWAKPGSVQGMRMIDVDRPGYAIGAKTQPDLLDGPGPTVTTNIWHQGSSERESQRKGTSLARRLSMLDRPAPTITTVHDEGRDKNRPSRRPRAELRELLKEAGILDRPSTVIHTRNDGAIAPAGHHDQHLRGCVRLGVPECAALQGFPPGWTWPATKTAAHRCIGNAVPPALGEAVGRSIAEALAASARPSMEAAS
jgi:DNA-cytosine methyltransferase